MKVFTLMLNVRAGKTSVERKPKVMGGTDQEAGNGALEETGREDAGKPCWFNSFSGGGQRRQRLRPDQSNRREEEEVGEDKRKEVKD